MKMFRMLLVMCCCTAITTSAGAVITGDVDGNIYVEGEASNFVNWAIENHGATATNMATLFDSTPGVEYSFTTEQVRGLEASLDIPFTLVSPLVTARLDYGSVVNSYGSNHGWVQLDVTTDEGTTKIYFHHSLDTDPNQSESMNYTPEGGVPNDNTERQRAYTIIDDLVAGKTEFTLNISVLRTSPNIYDGGCFLPDREVPGYWPESDFILSGTMVPYDPNYCGDLHTQYLDGDVSGPAGIPDCYVNLHDVALIAQDWLGCTDPENVDCIE